MSKEETMVERCVDKAFRVIAHEASVAETLDKGRYIVGGHVDLNAVVGAVIDALIDPTPAMLDAARNAVTGHLRPEAAEAVYRAMLSKAKEST